MWKDNTCNPATRSCQNEKHLASIMDGWFSDYDEIIDADVEAKLKDEDKNITYKTYW